MRKENLDINRLNSIAEVIDFESISIYLTDETNIPKLRDIQFLYFYRVYEATNLDLKYTQMLLQMTTPLIYRYKQAYEEFKQNSPKTTKSNKSAKQVIKTDKTGFILKCYPTISEAARDVPTTTHQLKRYINKVRSHPLFNFKFVD